MLSIWKDSGFKVSPAVVRLLTDSPHGSPTKFVKVVFAYVIHNMFAAM